MKNYKLKSFENFNYMLNEVGEANLKPYDIINSNVINYMGGEYITYFFETDSGIQYVLVFLRYMKEMLYSHHAIDECPIIDIDEGDYDEFYDTVMNISFFPYKGDPTNFSIGELSYAYQNMSDSIITNKGEQYKIMATIVKVIKEYLKNNPEVKYLLMGGEEGNKPNSAKQRENLYLAYLKKHLLHYNEDTDLCYLYIDFKHESYPLIKIK